MTGNSTYNYLADYLFKVRSKGRYSFTLDELKQSFNISDKALLQNLYRLKSKNQISQVRKRFYVIIPPEYSHTNMLPIYLFVDDLLKYLDREYYLGLFTAAALHGAGHQQPMTYQIIIKPPALREVKNDRLSIKFFTRNHWNKNDIVEKKTDAGYIEVSSPELTVLDLVNYSQKIGGINRIVNIIDELGDTLKPPILSRTAKSYPSKACVQRLGYLFERVLMKESLAQALHKAIINRQIFSVPLSVASKRDKTGKTDKKWKVKVNIELEIE